MSNNDTLRHEDQDDRLNEAVPSANASEDEGQRAATAQERRDAFGLLRQSAEPDLHLLKVASCWLVLASLIEALGPWLGKTLIDRVLLPRNSDWMLVASLLGGALVAGVASSWIRYFQLRKLASLAMNSVQRLRERVYGHVLHLPLSYFDTAITGQLVSRVTNDTEAAKALYVQVLFVMLEAVITVFGVFVLMVVLDWRLALIAASLIPAVLLVVWAYQRMSAASVARSRQLRSDINAQMAESVNGMSVLQATNASEQFAARYAATNQEHFRARMGEVRANAWMLRPMLDVMNVVLIVAVIYAFGLEHANGPLKGSLSLIEVGLLYAFINYIERVSDPLINITVQFAQFQQSVVAAARVNRLLQQTEQPVVIDGPTMTSGSVQVRDLSFAYGPKLRPGPTVLHSVSIDVPHGNFVGVVGHTGSGKSTLLSLLLRFYDVQSGSMQIDGHPVASYAEAHYRSMVSLVPQEPFLLAASAHENIDMGRGLPRERVQAAARAAQAHDFIEGLENGYATPLGEGGARLSVGQKQLIAIARALAAEPKILILDEATSHIDSETEVLVQRALTALHGHVTVIAVAHRLSTVAQADQIIVLNHGRVAERGRQSELLALEGGIYQRLHELQRIETEKGA